MSALFRPSTTIITTQKPRYSSSYRFPYYYYCKPSQLPQFSTAPTTSQLEPPKSHPQDVHRFIQSPTIPPAIHPGELWLLLAPRAPNGNLLPINSAFATISTTIYLQPRTFHPTNKCRPNKRILSITILTHPPTTSNHYCIAAASLQFPIQS